MLTLEFYRTLIGCLLTFVLVVFVAGCGSSGGDAAAEAPTGVTGINIIAGAGPIVAVQVGQTAVLDGSNSTTTSTQPLSYSWSFSSKPDASTAVLQGSSSENPSFIADAWGVYMVELVVSAEGVSSTRAITMVVATNPGERPTGPFNHQGLSSQCANCHDGGFSVIPGKPPTHVATSNLCQACHTPLGFNVRLNVDHREIFGNCSECHNGEIAIGKSEFHVQTNAECDDCHNTSHFLELGPDGSFDHSNISRSCTGCHNGTVAIGMPTTVTAGGNHPDTSSECGYCHTTLSFLNAYPDHTGSDVVGHRCDSCHGAGPAPGEPAGHPVMNVDCEVCHSIVTFSMGGVFSHNLVDPSVQPCASCHNDNNSFNAPGKASAVPAHPATNSDCGNCHNTESFVGAFTDHTGIVDNCARSGCHTGNPGEAIGKSVNHMPTIDDCSACHSPGTFTTGTYDHAGVVSGCASCHNNVISLGKHINHLPTTSDCSVCHNTTDFKLATFNHTGIDTSNCELCHDGVIALGKSVNHVPTSLDCSACHRTDVFNTFAGITFAHVGIDINNCAMCHDTGIATGKTANHIPVQGDCSVCHDSTTLFSSTTFLATVHPANTRGCEGCHTSRFFPTKPDLVKSASHLPTNQDCDSCHVNTAFTPSIFAHTGIAGNCASCHDGNYAGLGARGATDTAIHRNTSGDCVVCHNTTAFQDAFVDHSGAEVLGKRCDSCHDGNSATGKNAKTNPPHVVTSEDCNVCHVPGGSFTPAVFNHQGIVNNCASCHNGTVATGMSTGHLPTVEDCSVCHNTTAFAGARFDHQGIVANCATCHDGVTARGKTPPPNHVPTNSDCSVCHVTAGFLPATFSHAGIVSNCQSCHDGVFASGKPGTHIPTSQDCGVCHAVGTSFKGAVFDHTGIVNNCESCHDGVTAIGKQAKTNPPHIATALDCHFCHTTATFVGGTWDHQGITGNCGFCHDGVTATGSQPQGLNAHFITVAECNVCHSTQGWAPISFTHPGTSDYPGDHYRNIGCITCHDDNNENITYPWNQYAPYCAACHANNFRRKGDHIGGENGTVEQNKNCGQSGCHRVSRREW
jgi:hypothetical protein